MSGEPKGVDRTDRSRLSSAIRRCPLCAYDFAENEHEGCPSCPINRYCRVACCPNCGYEFVEDSWVVERWRDLKSFIGARRSGEEDASHGA